MRTTGILLAGLFFFVGCTAIRNEAERAPAFAELRPASFAELGDDWSRWLIGDDLLDQTFMTSAPVKIAFSQGLTYSRTKIDMTRLPNRQLPTGVFENSNDHGSAVFQILFGYADYRLPNTFTVTALEDGRENLADFSRAIQNILRSNADIFSSSSSLMFHSQAYEETPEQLEKVRQGLRAIEDAGMWLSLASGNCGESVDFCQPASRFTKGLIAGMINSDGFVDRRSGPLRETDVLVPGGALNFVRFEDGTGRFFGGTSGAQPLLARTLARLRSLLPKLHLESVSYLIKQTGLRAGPEILGRDGRPLTILNSYRAFIVAKELQAHRITSATPTQIDAALFAVARSAEDRVAHSLPALPRLKAVYLLNPVQTNALTLIKALDQNHQKAYADYFRALTVDALEYFEQQLESRDLIKEPNGGETFPGQFRFQSASRTVDPKYRAVIAKIIRRGLESTDGPERQLALQRWQSVGMSDEKCVELIENKIVSLAKDSDYEVRQRFEQVVSTLTIGFGTPKRFAHRCGPALERALTAQGSR